MTLDDRFDGVLAAARAGGDRAWTELYRDLAPVVLGYLRGHGAADPEDLLGEVFLRVVRSLETFDGDERGFRSWVFTIAYHRLLDERRRRARRPATAVETATLGTELPPIEGIEGEAVERVSTEELVALLDILTDEQRQVLLLRLVGGLTLAEVAEVIGRSLGATKQLQRRGLRSLAAHLERHGPYPLPAAERSRG